MSLARNLGRDLLNVPMGEMISSMALAIADAQYDLDSASIRVAQLMGGRMPVFDDEGKQTGEEDTRVYFGLNDDGAPQKVSMLELGFSPTFYQFTNNIIEVKIAIKMTYDREYTHTVNTVTNSNKKRNRGIFSIFGARNSTTTRTTTVDASYSSKYSYSAEGSSLLRCNLVPIPPPAIFEERVRDLFESDEEDDA
ncbi:MAG: hypothetical protein ACI9O6_000787 [Glaciecola sp.]|jgi:hypothetical protein